jgi:hypothetical protein
MVRVIIVELDENIVIILKYVSSYDNLFIFDLIYFQGLINGIEFGDFSESVTQTDFVLDDNGHETNMKFIAGFLGIGQNPKTGALRPCLGWASALPIKK